MQNIKYHSINTISVLFFSYVLASAVTQVYRYTAVPAVVPGQSVRQAPRSVRRVLGFDEYRPIIDSTFFKIARVPALGEGPGQDLQAAAVPETDLELMGTISGDWRISRALIKKKSESEAKIFKIGNTVHGYRLTRILPSKVHLKIGKDIVILDMFTDKDKAPAKVQSSTKFTSSTGNNIKQNLSRAELQQNVLKNMDNALQGMRAGPYRVDGKVEGYKIFRMRPHNVLYKLGARPGDVIRRVNGHPITSTEKLYKLWESVKTDSRITVDLERNRQPLHYEFNITD